MPLALELSKMNRVFKYETPSWCAKLMCSVYFLISGIFLVAYGTYGNWAGNSPWVLKYVFLILSLVFLLIVLKINKNRSVVGLSLQTFISYTIIFGIRSIIFIFYKVSIMINCRDIYLKIQQEISYLYYNNLWQLPYQGTFST